MIDATAPQRLAGRRGRGDWVGDGARAVATTIPDVRQLGLFALCNRYQLDRVRRLLTPVAVAAGEVLIEIDAPPREFAIIADGEVSVTDARGMELAVLGRGAIVGEIALLHDVPTAARVTTLTPTVVYVGNRIEFRALLEVSPAIDHHVLSVALDRLRAA